MHKRTPRELTGRRVLSLFSQEDAMLIYLATANLCAYFYHIRERTLAVIPTLTQDLNDGSAASSITHNDQNGGPTWSTKVVMAVSSWIWDSTS
jgi:hypothetical protein